MYSFFLWRASLQDYLFSFRISDFLLRLKTGSVSSKEAIFFV